MVANEVADLEQTVETQRQTIIDLERQLSMHQTELMMLRSQSRKLEDEHREAVIRSTAMKQIMTSMSAMLLDGIAKLDARIDDERKTRMAEEVERLLNERVSEKDRNDHNRRMMETRGMTVHEGTPLPPRADIIAERGKPDLEALQLLGQES